MNLGAVLITKKFDSQILRFLAILNNSTIVKMYDDKFQISYDF